jgi:hypothetical protein
MPESWLGAMILVKYTADEDNGFSANLCRVAAGTTFWVRISKDFLVICCTQSGAERRVVWYQEPSGIWAP